MIAVLLQSGLPLIIAVFVATLLVGWRVLLYLRRRQILDMPNERSSHVLPTPRGGGLATTPVMVAALACMPGFQSLAVGALLLLWISWLDDRRPLPPLPRFAVQAAAIAAWLLINGGEKMVFQGYLPAWIDHLLVFLAWLWFVNLYNFMDGIDGITGVQSLALGIGITAIGGLELMPPALSVAAVAAAFLCFNWHPAKMFLGDSGSIPLGFVLGGLLIELASRGHLAAALILPGYYLADATLTIGTRLCRGEKIWLPHRSHFYQRAVQGGKRHDQVAWAIGIGNLALLGCALAVPTWDGWAIGAAVAVVVVLLACLEHWSRKGSAP